MEIIAAAFRQDYTLWRLSLATLAENNCTRELLFSLENYLGGTRLRNRLRPGRQELGSQGTVKVSWSRHHGHWKHTLDAASGPAEGILI